VATNGSDTHYMHEAHDRSAMAESTQQLEVWCVGEDWWLTTTTATLIGKK